MHVLTRQSTRRSALHLPHLPCHRRDFLRVGSLSLLGLGLSDYLESVGSIAGNAYAEGDRKATAQACILLWLEGGPSQIDTWDPKPHSGFHPISTRVPGIQVSELFPRIANHLDKLALVRSMHTKENNHPQGTHYALTGHRPSPATTFPSLGSIISKEMGSRNHLPPYMMVPMHWEGDFFSYVDAFNAAFIGSQYNPIIISDPSQKTFEVADLRLPKSLSQEDIESRRRFLQIVDRQYRERERNAKFFEMDRFTEQAWKMLSSPTVKNAFDLSLESDKTREAYGQTRVGQSVLLARRLVESGCRFVTASGYKHGEWDTHGNNDVKLRDTLAPALDQTLAALIEDLDQRGLLETTLVLVMGEFGRTPHINAALGRDHYPDCWSLLLAGGGIRGGQVVGSSDSRGAYVADRLVTMGDLFATLYKALGIDWTKTYVNPSGRPLYIANSIDDKLGQPLEELI